MATSNPLFKRPDWRCQELYLWIEEEGAELQRIAWEFLRRNSEFHSDIYDFCKAWLHTQPREPELSQLEDLILDSGLFDNEDTKDAWRTSGNANKWLINTPTIPNCDEGWINLSNTLLDAPHSFNQLGPCGELYGPRVSIPVDLTLPIDVSLSRIEEEIRELRQRGIKAGLFEAQTTRVQSRKLYAQYLRILDAVASNTSIPDIGAELMPEIENTSEDRQRDKRIRAAIAAAEKMQTLGYQALLNRDPTFLKN